MPRGFIRDELQLKLLILYILDHLIQPVTLPQLTDLALCDDGVDYFSFAQALCELESTGHVTLEGELYHITPKGQAHCRECTGTVPYSVRTKCDRNTGVVNATLRQGGKINTAVVHRQGEEYTVKMSLSDDAGSVLSMEMLSFSREQSDRVAKNFHAHAEEIFNVILSALTAEYDNNDQF